MKTYIYEIGVIDTLGKKHPVRFKQGLNVVTGKSSTGKSALIEIFDYCFASSENTVPKGIITDNAWIYYVAINIDNNPIVLARDPSVGTKAFFKQEEVFNSEDIDCEYFSSNYFMPLSRFKKQLQELFLDFDDVDESLSAQEARGRKAPTPSIRSFMSFILQHQNLVANKHALFYRFDEKEKRDQVIEHIKIFLNLVDQKYFHLMQERERLTLALNRLKRQQEVGKRAADMYRQSVGPVLTQLYAMMGFTEEQIVINAVLRDPQGAKDKIDKIIVPEKINYSSDAVVQRYNKLKVDRTQYTIELRKLQRQAISISKHIQEEERFVSNVNQFDTPKHVHVSGVVCPFCQTKQDSLQESAVRLQQAIVKISDNLAQAQPMKAKFQSTLVNIKRSIDEKNNIVESLSGQIKEIEDLEKELKAQNGLYESILMQKAKLFAMLDTISFADDSGMQENIEKMGKDICEIDKSLRQYNVKLGLANADQKVNGYMSEIGRNFEFEKSYQPINLRFSFETFDLFHLNGEEKIYLRSMGSGANWLYCHITLFLAMHKYFAELGDKCAIPSLLFFDQPTQVYFPNFNRDNSISFEEQKKQEAEQRKQFDVPQDVDEDIRAVENLFSQLSTYCNELEKTNGFSPQIIVTDHADSLNLTDGVLFDSLVNGNRWRKRGLIDPLPASVNA